MTHTLHAAWIGLFTCMGLSAVARAAPEHTIGDVLVHDFLTAHREMDSPRKQVRVITMRIGAAHAPDGVEMRAGIQHVFRLGAVEVPELCVRPVYPNPLQDPAAVKCIEAIRGVTRGWSDEHPPPGTYRAGDALTLVPGLAPDLTLAGQALDVRYDGGPPLMAIDARDTMARIRAW